MKLLDFFAAENRICRGADGALQCSKETCLEEGGDYGLIFKTQHPWFCRWRHEYPEEYTFALKHKLVKLLPSMWGCSRPTRKGFIIHDQLRGDYS